MPDLPSLTNWPIYNNMPLPCLLINPDYSIVEANESYLLHYQCTKEEVVGNNFFSLLQADAPTVQVLQTSFLHVLNTNSAHEVPMLQFDIQPSKAGMKPHCWSVKNVPAATSGKKSGAIIHFATPVSCPGDDSAGNRSMVQRVKNYGIFSLDKNGIITSWNKGAENIKGYTAAETIGRSMDIFYTRVDLDNGIPAKNLELALKNDGLETEGWRIRKDGSAFYANIIFTPLFNEKGEHYGFSKVTRDITEDRNNSEYTNFLADITRNIEDPIITTDTQLNITRWNRAAERLFGWKEPEAIGRSTLEVLRSQFSTRERNDILQSLQQHGYWQGEVTYLNKNGQQLICLCTVSHLKDTLGHISGNLVLLKDITQRKTAEEELARLNNHLEQLVTERTSQLLNTEKKFEQLFENNPMPMWVIRQSDFRFLAVNNMAVMQYGYSREEFLSMTALDIRPESEKDTFLNADHPADTTTDNYNRGIWKHRKKNGDIIMVQVMVHYTVFDGTEAKMILANDITGQVLAEEKIAASERQLRNTLNSMMEGIQIHSFDWRYIFVNDALVQFDGSSREELIGIRLMDKYPGIEQTDVFKAMNRVMQKRVTEQMETDFVFPDGRVSSFQLSIQPVPEGIFVLSIDITERKLAQEKYIKSQENYRTMMERISDAFIALDANWNYEYVNKAASVILNRDADDLTGKNVWEEFPEAVNYRLYNAFKESLETQQHIQLEEFYAPFDMWMEFNIYPSPQGITVFFSNINKRKWAEQKLVQSEANLKAIFDNTSEGFILTDTEGKVKAFNHRVTEIVLPNVTSHMHIGVNVFQLTEESRLEFFRHMFRQVLAGETVQYDRQYTLQDGTTLWINLGFNPVLEGESIAGVCITAKDITERKRNEEQLQKSYFEKRALAEKLSAILNTLPANIALVDPTGRIVEVNDPWRNFAIENNFRGEHFGLGQNYLTVSRNATGPDKDDGQNVAFGLSKVLEEEMHEFVYEYPCDSSEQGRWFRMIATPLQKKEYAGAVIMHLDISEVRRLEAERLQMQLNEQKKITQAILQGQEKERNHIGKELHDNINQMLAGTRMFLSIAGSKNSIVKESVQYPMELLDQSIEEIRKLCANMVTPMQDVKLEELVQELLKKLSSNSIETVFRYNIPDHLLTDELKLNIYRIVQELSTNILKYAKAGLVTVELSVDNDEVQLVVTDNGRGFNTNTKKNGIGLSNIRSRVQSFNGIIHIESSEGNGTKTMARIPL